MDWRSVTLLDRKANTYADLPNSGTPDRQSIKVAAICR
jgi:hypothetical protein